MLDAASILIGCVIGNVGTIFGMTIYYTLSTRKAARSYPQNRLRQLEEGRIARTRCEKQKYNTSEYHSRPQQRQKLRTTNKPAPKPTPHSHTPAPTVAVALAVPKQPLRTLSPSSPQLPQSAVLSPNSPSRVVITPTPMPTPMPPPSTAATSQYLLTPAKGSPTPTPTKRTRTPSTPWLHRIISQHHLDRASRNWPPRRLHRSPGVEAPAMLFIPSPGQAVGLDLHYIAQPRVVPETTRFAFVPQNGADWDGQGSLSFGSGSVTETAGSSCCASTVLSLACGTDGSGDEELDTSEMDTNEVMLMWRGADNCGMLPDNNNNNNNNRHSLVITPVT